MNARLVALTLLVSPAAACTCAPAGGGDSDASVSTDDGGQGSMVAAAT